jgi:hypothetical protein
MNLNMVRILFIFLKLTIESKNIELFSPNLIPVYELCVLTYSHNFDVFYMEGQP